MPQPAAPLPHLDPTRWGHLIDSIDAAPIFVVIRGWLGTNMRTELSVEDIWQETLWLAWRDRQQHLWVNVAKYRAWLLGIAHHRVQQHVRSLGRRKRGGQHQIERLSELGGIDTSSDYLPPRSTTPSRTASHTERARLLESALATLEEPHRAVLRLRLFEELSTEETARRLAITLSTCKHRLLRGMQAYRAALRDGMRTDFPRAP